MVGDLYRSIHLNDLVLEFVGIVPAGDAAHLIDYPINAPDDEPVLLFSVFGEPEDPRYIAGTKRDALSGDMFYMLADALRDDIELDGGFEIP